MNSQVSESALEFRRGFDRAAFEAFVAQRDDPGWVVDLRREAFEAFEEKQLSPLDPEEWKRVDLRAFRPNKFGIRGAAAAAGGAELAALLQDRVAFGGVVTHLDGACTRTELSEELAAKGVLLGDLSSLVREHRSILEPHLQQAARDGSADRFAVWQAAFWTGGTVLYVPRGVRVDAPFYSQVALGEEAAADLSQTLVILEEGASATLLEETASAHAASTGLHVGSVKLCVAGEARLRYVQLQNWNEQVWHFARQTGYVGRDAELQWTVGGLGAKLAHIHQEVSLDGSGAAAEVNGVTFATDKQLLSYYTQQTHNAPHTRSDLLYKDVLRDNSRVVWRGMIKVAAEAQQTDGYQRNDSLLLSSTCRADAIPGLEIEADDVRCTHGATAGRVDQDQVFYCMCRGLTEYEAMHVIVEGFFQTVFDRIPVEVVRETLSRAVERKLGIGD